MIIILQSCQSKPVSELYNCLIKLYDYVL